MGRSVVLKNIQHGKGERHCLFDHLIFCNQIPLTLFFRVLCETIKDFVAKVGNAHDEKLDDSDDMSVKVSYK